MSKKANPVKKAKGEVAKSNDDGKKGFLFYCLGRTKASPTGTYTIDGKVIVKQVGAKIGLSSDLNELPIVERGGKNSGRLKECLVYAINKPLPKNCRLAISQHGGSGGNRIAIDNGIDSAISCLVSNTDKKLTFQRRGNALRLETLFDYAKTIDCPLVEQQKGSVNGTGSYVQYSFYDTAKAKLMIDKAFDLLK